MTLDLGNITVVGAGAIGGTVAVFLAEVGEKVAIVDRSVPHTEAIRSNGLLVDGIYDEHRVTFDKVLFPEELKGPLDFVILAVKSQHTEDALSTIKPLLSEKGFVVSLQNGLNERRIAEVVGGHRTIGGMVDLVGNHLGPGHVRRHNKGVFYVGELDGRPTERIQEVAKRLSRAVPTDATTNIWGYIWAKLAHTCVNVGTALVDAPSSETYKPEWARRVFLAIMGEVAEVAQAEGIRIEEYDGFDPKVSLVRKREDLPQALEMVPKGSSKGNSGIWLDIKVRKRKTEIEHLNGEVVRLGRKHGLPMTLNSLLYKMAREIEEGRRSMSWDNLRFLEKYANERLPK